MSCEHASAHVPRAFAACIVDRSVLATHRAYDIGALAVARRLARRFRAPLFFGRCTRLLIDLNRSMSNRDVFSPWSRTIDEERRTRLVELHYRPYRASIERAIAEGIRGRRRVLHLAIHSFTPVLRERLRNADLGLLYDPSRRREVELCRAWQRALGEVAPQMRVRRNYPYRGTSDGLIPGMRRRFPAERYVGVELEMNQRHLVEPDSARRLARAVESSLVRLLEGRLPREPAETTSRRPT